MQSHSNTPACQFITLPLTHTDHTSVRHTNRRLHTLFKPSPGISCHTTCLQELSGDRRCQLRVLQMPTSSQAEEKSSPSPSIICTNPSWEIVKSTPYLTNSISHRQVLISYLDPFPSPADDKSASTKCDYLLIFSTFLHDLTPDNGAAAGGWWWWLMGGEGGFKNTTSPNFEVLSSAEPQQSQDIEDWMWE